LDLNDTGKRGNYETIHDPRKRSWARLSGVTDWFR